MKTKRNQQIKIIFLFSNWHKPEENWYFLFYGAIEKGQMTFGEGTQAHKEEVHIDTK